MTGLVATLTGASGVKAERAAPQEKEQFLDLTTPEVLRAERAQTLRCPEGGSVGGVSDGGMIAAPTPALRLEVVNVNRESFQEGDEVVCELRVRNEGGRPIFIPWSVDQAVALDRSCSWRPSTGGTRYAKMELTLDVTDEYGNQESVAASVLYGGSGDAATGRFLPPGQDLRVKIRGVFDSSVIKARLERSGRRFVLPMRLTARGSLRWIDTAVPNKYGPVRSTNTVQVTAESK